MVSALFPSRLCSPSLKLQQRGAGGQREGLQALEITVEKMSIVLLCLSYLARSLVFRCVQRNGGDVRLVNGNILCVFLTYKYG